jgi:hypothetical protein
MTEQIQIIFQVPGKDAPGFAKRTRRALALRELKTENPTPDLIDALVDFLQLQFVEQELAGRLGCVDLVSRKDVLIDVGIVQPDLATLHLGESVGDLDLASPHRLHLRASQNQPSLVGIEDVVVPPGFGVGDDFGHTGRASSKTPEKGFSGATMGSWKKRLRSNRV